MEHRVGFIEQLISLFGNVRAYPSFSKKLILDLTEY